MEIKKPIIQKSNLKKITGVETSPLIDIENTILEEGAFENREIEEFKLTSVIAENLLCSSIKIGEVVIRDSVLTKCDFSGAISNQATLERMELHKCRIQGTQFMNANVKDVVIKNSKGGGVSFRFSKMKNVAFVECDLRDADFQGAEMENVIFEDCNLEGAQLYRTKLHHVNIKSSNIENIQIDKESFGKVIVSAEQALYLASIFGLVIEG